MACWLPSWSIFHQTPSTLQATAATPNASACMVTQLSTTTHHMPMGSTLLLNRTSYCTQTATIYAHAISFAGGEAVSARPGDAALGALCGLVDFLRESMLDRAVLSLGRCEALPSLSRVREWG